jgi:hypothetical protein
LREERDDYGITGCSRHIATSDDELSGGGTNTATATTKVEGRGGEETISRHTTQFHYKTITVLDAVDGWGWFIPFNHAASCRRFSYIYIHKLSTITIFIAGRIIIFVIQESTRSTLTGGHSSTHQRKTHLHYLYPIILRYPHHNW